MVKRADKLLQSLPLLFMLYNEPHLLGPQLDGSFLDVLPVIFVGLLNALLLAEENLPLPPPAKVGHYHIELADFDHKLVEVSEDLFFE